MEQIITKTIDNVQIHGDFYKSAHPDHPAGLLLHMMPATKESWKNFAEKLNDNDFHALAIDFRGHGKSVLKNNNPIDYRHFNDTEHQQKINDIEAAFYFLKHNGIYHNETFLAGASIGANLTLQYMSQYPEIKAGIILSPGLNYRGIEPEQYVKKITGDQSIFLIASEDDQYSAESAKKLYNIATCRKQIKILPSGGHGTDMFIAHPELMDEIINWVKNIYK